MTGTGAPSAPVRTVDDAFLDLIYGDEEFLRAEFDALISASWDPPPPRPPALPEPADRPPGWPAAPTPDAAPTTPAWPRPSRRRLTRQRAPPPGFVGPH